MTQLARLCEWRWLNHRHTPSSHLDSLTRLAAADASLGVLTQHLRSVSVPHKVSRSGAFECSISLVGKCAELDARQHLRSVSVPHKVNRSGAFSRLASVRVRGFCAVP